MIEISLPFRMFLRSPPIRTAIVERPRIFLNVAASFGKITTCAVAVSTFSYVKSALVVTLL